MFTIRRQGKTIYDARVAKEAAAPAARDVDAAAAAVAAGDRSGRVWQPQ